MLLKNAQILSERANAINEHPHQASTTRTRRPRWRAHRGARLGYKAVAWQEANELLLEALVVRNVIMYTVVGAIMLVAGFGIFNIISTITHEKARDIAILKSLGFPQGDMRRLFLLEGLALGRRRLAARLGCSAFSWLCAVAGAASRSRARRSAAR